MDIVEMIYTQMEQDFIKLAQDHEVAASNERLLINKAKDPETKQIHEENVETHVQIAHMYRQMLGDILSFIESYDLED